MSFNPEGLEGVRPGLVRTSLTSGVDQIHDAAIGRFGGREALVVAGESDGTLAVARYHLTSGLLDTAFNGTGWVRTPIPGASSSTAHAVAVQPDGKILVGGVSSETLLLGSLPAHYDVALLARYQQDGRLDESFGSNGMVRIRFGDYGLGPFELPDPLTRSGINDLSVDIVSGQLRITVTGFSDSQIAVARFHNDGTLDQSFSGDGVLTTSYANSSLPSFGTPPISVGNSLLTSDDGSQIVVGNYDVGGIKSIGMLRIANGGQVSRSVVSTSTPFDVEDAEVDLQGRIVVVGGSHIGNFAIARINSDGSPDQQWGSSGVTSVDFGGDDHSYELLVQADGKILAMGSGNGRFAIARLNSDGSLDDGSTNDSTPSDSFGTAGKVTTRFFSSQFTSDYGFAAVAQDQGTKLIVAGSTWNYLQAGADFALARYIVNLPPESRSDTVTVEDNAQVGITLAGHDPDGNWPSEAGLVFEIESPPRHGVLSPISSPVPTVLSGEEFGYSAVVGYTREPDFVGVDQFTFTVIDPLGAKSPPSTIRIVSLPSELSTWTGCGILWDGELDNNWFSEVKVTDEFGRQEEKTNWTPESVPSGQNVCIFQDELAAIRYQSVINAIWTPVGSLISNTPLHVETGTLTLEENSLLVAPDSVFNLEDGLWLKSGGLAGRGDLIALTGVRTGPGEANLSGHIDGDERDQSTLDARAGLSVEPFSGRLRVENRTIRLSAESYVGDGSDVHLTHQSLVLNTGVLRLNPRARIDAIGDATGISVINSGSLIGANQAAISAPFENTGVFEVAVGAQVTLGRSQYASDIRNLDATDQRLSGGRWIIQGELRFPLTPAANIDVNDSDIVLRGAAASMNALSTLRENRGSLAVESGARFATTGDLSSSGDLRIGTASEPVSLNTLQVTGNLRLNGGQLTVHEGGQVEVDERVIVGSNATICTDGTIRATKGLLLQGTLEIGCNHSGSGEILGDLEQEQTGALSVALGSASRNTLAVSGSVRLRGQLDLSIASEDSLTIGQAFTLIDNRNSNYVEGTFDGLPNGTVFSVGGYDVQITYFGGDGNDVVVRVVPQGTQSPSSVDTDGDGLLDLWETHGIDVDFDGVVDLNLPGASPMRKDLYLEVDTVASQPTGPSLSPVPHSGTISGYLRGAGPEIRVRSPNHGLTTGVRVRISGALGFDSIDGVYAVTRVNSHEFDLQGSSSMGPYVGGTWSLEDVIVNGLATGTSLDLVVDSFLRAPVLNPGPDSGIQLHLEVEKTSSHNIVAEVPSDDWNRDFNANGQIDNQDLAVALASTKQRWFGTSAQRSSEESLKILAAKRMTYRYAVFGQNNASQNPTSGIMSFGDLAVFTNVVPLSDQQAGTFMHELGHALGLQHGGGDIGESFNYKPNYPSVMNYLWQFPTSGVPALDQSWRLDYSHGNANSLDETYLDEEVGIGGRTGSFTWSGPLPGFVVSETEPVDWDRSGVISIVTDLDFDINPHLRDPALSESGQILSDHNDWDALKFAPGLAGFGLGDVSAPGPIIEELSVEDLVHQEKILKQTSSRLGVGASFSNPVHICTVTNTNDGGTGSLRAALECANAIDSDGVVIVDFVIPDSDPNYVDIDSDRGGDAEPDVFEIALLRPLPAITRGSVVINGQSQWNATWDTNPFGPEIVLSGALAGSGANGLVVRSSDNLVHGLNIQGFSGNGILIEGNGNTITGSYIGTDPTGTSRWSLGRENMFAEDFEGDLANWTGKNLGPHNGLIVADPLRPGNHALTFTSVDGFGDIFSREITVTPGQRYELSFEYLGLPGVGGIAGNLGGVIGFTDAVPGTQRWLAGTTSGPGSGIESDSLIDDGQWRSYRIEFDPSQPGLYFPAISGDAIRLMIEDWIGSGGVAGDALFDDIRLSVAGNVSTANKASGVMIVNSRDNVIGGISAGDRNVISGNALHGIRIIGNSFPDGDVPILTDNPDQLIRRGNVVLGNFIGVGSDGSTLLGNQQSGIELRDTSLNVIGRPELDSLPLGEVIQLPFAHPGGNVISANGQDGITLVQSHDNTIQGNHIGVDYLGWEARGNGQFGIWVFDSAGNQIGGGGEAQRNVISANVGSNIGIYYEGSVGNKVQGNYIGLDSSGRGTIVNPGWGIDATYNVSFNVIGVDGDGVDDATEGNVIGGHRGTQISQAAVYLVGHDNTVAGNWLGTDATGLNPRGNVYGVHLAGDRNRVGTNGDGVSDDLERNVIANNDAGVSIFGGADNVVAGNYIGTDRTGNRSLGNGAGLGIGAGVLRTRIGTNGDGVSDELERNIVSGQGGIIGTSSVGIGISGVDTLVAGNYVGIGADGLTVLGNASHGILITETAVGTRIGGSSTSRRNVISGNAGNGVYIQGSSTTDADVVAFVQGEGNAIESISGGHTIEGNYIGTTVDGMSPLGNNSSGVYIEDSADNLIGGVHPGSGNVLSGNVAGVTILGSNASGNRVQGNLVGLAADGKTPLGNSYRGIGVLGSFGQQFAPDNQIGGSEPGAGNVISGNAYEQILIAKTQGTIIQGNIIGLDSTGTQTLTYAQQGIRVEDDLDSLIGGSQPGEGNVISGSYYGIYVNGRWMPGGTQRLTIQGNRVGTDRTGEFALANFQGIYIDGYEGGDLRFESHDVLIGGTEPGAGNLVSGNQTAGIIVRGPNLTGIKLQGNLIGTDADGLSALPNGDGLVIDNASHALVGGAQAGAGNVIAGNADAGIELVRNSRGTRIQGNLIGTDRDGAAAIANRIGVYAYGGASETIVGVDGDGVNDSAERNLISGNEFAGIELYGDRNVVAGNLIGTDITGQGAIGNGHGVRVIGSLNRVGTDADGVGDEFERNVISGNHGVGFGIYTAPNGLYLGNDNVVAGNFIGTNLEGTRMLGNDSYGVSVSFLWETGGPGELSPRGNLIGGDSAIERNVIAGSYSYGVLLDDAVATRVLGNFIGTSADGTQPFPNNRSLIAEQDGGSAGVMVVQGSRNRIGGGKPGEGNLISGNNGAGVTLWFTGTEKNLVQGNRIGTTAAADAALPNIGPGVLILGGAAENVIGSDGDGANDDREGNLISGNFGSGIAVTGDLTRGITIRRNSIHSNGGLGIDLGSGGVTLNDDGSMEAGILPDLDLGPNMLQNFPEIKSVKSGTTTKVTGQFRSTPNRSFLVDVYASANADITGYGEGQRWLGAVLVTTNGEGVTSVNASLDAPTTDGEFITATATSLELGANGVLAPRETSEFSSAFQIKANDKKPHSNASAASFESEAYPLAGQLFGVFPAEAITTDDSNPDGSFSQDFDAVLGQPLGWIASGIRLIEGKVQHDFRRSTDSLRFVTHTLWQNPIHPADVNGDGMVSARDALMILNHLHVFGSGPVDALINPEPSSTRYLDVSGSIGLERAEITALDALRVINTLTGVDSEERERIPTAARPDDERVSNAVALGTAYRPADVVAVDDDDQDWDRLINLLAEDQERLI